jgi:hypothetical protein
MRGTKQAEAVPDQVCTLRVLLTEFLDQSLGDLHAAPADLAPTANRNELLVRVSQRMLVRDDEDLAIEHLSGAGREDNANADPAAGSPGELRQERAAARAEATRDRDPTTPARTGRLASSSCTLG